MDRYRRGRGRDIPSQDNNEEQEQQQRAARPMPPLARGTYLALKRALDNIWYGNPAPLGEATTYVRMERGEEVSLQEVEVALADFVNLLSHALPSLQETEPLLLHATSARKTAILERVTAGYLRLHELSQELHTMNEATARLSLAYSTKRREKRAFETQIKALTTRQKNLQTRLETLSAKDQEVTELLQMVGDFHPVTIEGMTTIAQALHQCLAGTSCIG